MHEALERVWGVEALSPTADLGELRECGPLAALSKTLAVLLTSLSLCGQVCEMRILGAHATLHALAETAGQIKRSAPCSVVAAGCQEMLEQLTDGVVQLPETAAGFSA